MGDASATELSESEAIRLVSLRSARNNLANDIAWEANRRADIKRWKGTGMLDAQTEESAIAAAEEDIRMALKGQELWRACASALGGSLP